MIEVIFDTFDPSAIHRSEAERVILRGSAKDRFLAIAKEEPLPDDVQITGYRRRLNFGPMGCMLGLEWYWEPVGLSAPPQPDGAEA